MTEEDGFVTYNRCFSPASWTMPSHVSLFTGLYPNEHNIGNHICMPDNTFCLAEILKYLGYTTFGVTSNNLISRLLNFHRGFDEFYEMWHFFNSSNFFEINEAINISKKNVEGELGRFLLLLRLSSSHRAYTFLLKKFIDSTYKKMTAPRKKSVHSTRRTINTAKKIINSQNTQSPFFLFLNIMETHNQYNPPSRITAFGKISRKARSDALKKYDWHHYVSPFSAETFEILNVLYDREVLFLDSVLWDFYSFLKNKKILDNTLLIITSDHGEFLGEHGQFNHVFTLYNELLHVPLLIKFPKDFALKGKRNTLVQLHDVFATIADVTGSPLPVPDSSHSLLSSASRKIAHAQLLSCDHTLHKYRRKSPSFSLQDFMQPYTSLITDYMMKIIKRADGNTELYDLSRDLYETQELSNDPAFAEQKQKLSALLMEPHRQPVTIY
jgi:arylsulfatase A-like enzyme